MQALFASLQRHSNNMACNLQSCFLLLRALLVGGYLPETVSDKDRSLATTREP